MYNDKTFSKTYVTALNGNYIFCHYLVNYTQTIPVDW